MNILVSGAGRACLADFGLSTAKDSKPLMTTLASSTKNSGTLRWQAPELMPDMQFDENSPHDQPNSFATDVYALALVFYEVCTLLMI